MLTPQQWATWVLMGSEVAVIPSVLEPLARCIRG